VEKNTKTIPRLACAATCFLYLMLDRDDIIISVPQGCVPHIHHVPGTRGLQGGCFPMSPFWGDVGGLGGTRLPKVGDESPQKGDSRGDVSPCPLFGETWGDLGDVTPQGEG
jgi:hypothetical protein